MSNNKKWISSKEAMKLGKIKSCDLMHHRLAGDIEYEKRGNAYYYNRSDIEKIIQKDTIE